MNAVKVTYHKDSDSIELDENQSPENWLNVCDRFNDDVHRVRDVDDQKEYSALFECFDDDDRSVFYLVEENRKLEKLKRKHFRDKLGLS